MKLPTERSLAVKDLNKERIGYIHFSVTKEGYFRCGEGEDKYGKDCDFRRFVHLSSLAKHYQKHHFKTIMGISDVLNRRSKKPQ